MAHFIRLSDSPRTPIVAEQQPSGNWLYTDDLGRLYVISDERFQREFRELVQAGSGEPYKMSILHKGE